MQTDHKLTTTHVFYIAWATLTAFGLSCGGSTPASPSSPQPPPTPPSVAAPTVTGVTPTLGATSGGLGITITGTGFSSGATVSIGGAAATSVAVVSAASITATTPARTAGAADIVVTNADGQGGRLTGGFTYNAPVVPPPSIAAVSPTSGPEAGGTVVTITGSGFVSGATVSFGTAAASAVNVTGSGSLTATAPARSAGSVDLVVANPDGQAARMSGVFTYLGSAPPPPPPAPVAPTVTGVAPASATTAGGTTVTVTGTGFAAGATVSFDGTPGSNVVVASATSITATTPPHAAGGVAVAVTNTDGLSGRLNGGLTYTAPAPPPATVIVITITPAGATPSTLTIAPGTRIRFVNNDVLAHDMTSDPHPDHTQCPPLNQVGLLLPGQSRESDPFTTIRTCGFHDHSDADNPRWTGTIQIK